MLETKLSFTAALLAAFGLAACGGSSKAPATATPNATTTAGPAQPAAHKHRIVFHLTDAAPQQAKLVMTNVQNTITGFGGMPNFEALEVVVHGPAVKNFVSDNIEPDLKESVDKLVAQGVTLTICGNTMTKMNIDKSRLASGCSIANQGGVVRIIELQEKGYAYMRP